MIEIAPGISIDEKDLRLDFIRSAGPGGQNVNKVSTAVQLRFDLAGNETLPEAVRRRLTTLAGRRLNAAGELIIEARRYRTQGANRQDAIERLAGLIRSASRPPRARKPTKPSAASRHKRLESKRRRAATKSLRRKSVQE
ncbi:MAG: aminoacyl-tRNA hydrolase [Planctomycetaceae bacterium]|nr:aminoacyl-tRNA hydrolase [Planctomycetaceae bacterium]